MEVLAVKQNQKIRNVSDVPELTHQGISISSTEIREGKEERKNQDQNLQGDSSLLITVGENATLKVKKRLRNLAEDLKELWNTNTNQKRALGLLTTDCSPPEVLITLEDILEKEEEKENEEKEVSTTINDKAAVTFFSSDSVPFCQVSAVTTATAISSDFETRENKLPCQQTVWSVSELRPQQSKDEMHLSRLELLKLTGEKEELRRLLAESKNDIDDLKYLYEQKIHFLQGELNTYQGISVRLHELENTRNMECILAARKLTQYEEEVTTLRKLLVLSTEKEFSLQSEKEGMEESTMSQISSLEDALGTAAKMNAVLLENAEKRDLAYSLALKEMENLRKKMMEVRNETVRQKEIYEEKIKNMEIEIRSLQYFKENFSDMGKGLIEHSLYESMMKSYEEELNRLRSSLSYTNNLVLDLKRENTILSSNLEKTNISKCDAFTQCAVITQSNASVNTSTGLNSSESTLQIIKLTREIDNLTRERDELYEKLEAAKQAHNIENDFLTGKLIKTESDLQLCQSQMNSRKEKNNSLIMCDKTTQVTECILNTDLTTREKLIQGDVNDTVKHEATLIVNLSPRLKERSGGIEFCLPSKECNVESQNKLPIEEVEDSRKSFSKKLENREPLYHSLCRGPNHDTEACLWCSNRVNKSLGGTFGISNSHQPLSSIKR
ncbi:uncharacterized protein TM35_000221920 [Trypanosoma theileri]|uniref:Uncharacterized protein n=1 Tax=Trypanosoma theileri TaxID=67003 RepID=A0A1X0NSD9_9TRYP|nr:uncharacterized protein TM35_000221920 [Trypanosoma theileri]ORC87393.1 hypothetical protein TM35_000221920 [Trypanosoma theileri]